MLQPARHKAAIHPSIDALVGLIRDGKRATPAEDTALRELCRNKIRSYREDDYLKRFAAADDQKAARERWRVVADFANRRV